MPNAIETVNSAFGKLRQKYTFVSSAQHGATLRNAYASLMPEASPHIVVSSTMPWHPNQPEHVFASEHYNPSRESGPLDDPNNLKALNDAVPAIVGLGKPVVIFDSWTNGTLAQRLAARVGAEHVVTRSEHDAEIETKALLPTYLEEAGCTTAKTPRYYSFGSTKVLPDYSSFIDTFGEKFVIQGAGLAGSGTRIVTSAEEYDKAKRTLEGKIRVSEFVDAPYSAVYCLSLPTPDGKDVATYVDVPSFKPVGLQNLGIKDVEGGGGDWRGSRPDFDMLGMTNNVSKLLSYFYKKFGYSGLYVIEGFSKGGDFLFNEVNARVGGRSEVNTTYQYQDGYPGFIPLHILAGLDLLDSSIVDHVAFNERARERTAKGTPRGAFGLKAKNPFTQPITPSHYYQGPGIYLAEGNQLRWHRTGLATSDPDFDKGEVLIANGPLSRDVVIYPGRNLADFESFGTIPIFDANNRLNPMGQQLAAGIINLFNG